MGLIQVGILAIVVIVIVCDQVLEGSLLNKHRDVIEELIMAGTKGAKQIRQPVEFSGREVKFWKDAISWNVILTGLVKFRKFSSLRLARG